MPPVGQAETAESPLWACWGALEDAVKPGDWIMIHLGFAVEIVDRAEAERALSGLEMMGRPREGGPSGMP